MSAEKRAHILTSAIGVFGRYGFKRASMEDIAEAAGMSRPALYQYFRNKAEIFRAGSEFAQNAAIDAAENVASHKGLAFADRLAEMLIAYKHPAWRVVAATPHGDEMMGLNAALAEDVTEAATERATALFAKTISVEAAPGWDELDAARLLTRAAWTVIQNASDEDTFFRDIRLLASIWATALTQRAES